jgi:hypothetical protein
LQNRAFYLLNYFWFVVFEVLMAVTANTDVLSDGTYSGKILPVFRRCFLPPSSVLKSMKNKGILASYLLGFLLGPEDGGGSFF